MQRGKTKGSTMDYTQSAHDIVILGAGFTGTSLAVELHRRGNRPQRVALVSGAPEFAKGVAYSTPYDEHLLNVPAGNMSALADEPEHFVAWLRERFRDPNWCGEQPAQPLAKQFVPRKIYGQYLRSLLDSTVAPSAAGVEVERKNSEARSVTRGDGGWRIVLADDSTLQASSVVLATGNQAPAPLLGNLTDDLWLNNPWQWDRLRQFAQKPSLLLVGTGLTMVDVLLSLARDGHSGRVTACSRRGLLPQAHRWHVAPTSFAVDTAVARRGPEPLRAQLEKHFAEHPDEDWRGAIDSLRPHTQPIWKSWSEEARANFLAKHRAQWDVRRHRIAPPVARQLDELRQSGRLEVVKAGALAAEPTSDGRLVVTLSPAEGQAPIQRTVDGAINCTGPTANVATGPSALLRGLAEAGHLRPDAHRLGVDVTDGGQVLDGQGTPNQGLFAAGPLTKSQLWEIVAVPDIRRQTAALARQLA
jgi:uncharacterized NAD(P)/FAD-binding protein YdhS